MIYWPNKLNPSSRRIGARLRPLLRSKAAASVGGYLEGQRMLRKLTCLTLTHAWAAHRRHLPYQTTAAFFATAPPYPRKQRLLNSGRGSNSTYICCGNRTLPYRSKHSPQICVLKPHTSWRTDIAAGASRSNSCISAVVVVNIYRMVWSCMGWVSHVRYDVLQLLP